ncbi:hypothetical protein ACFYT4_16375 [Streptomyces sp. NPDC004609]|uniref:hypothetical protein n=1 Tax=Streptomyces sp. NPDC004609 TaxID=3364704 RepID=UPI003682250A
MAQSRSQMAGLLLINAVCYPPCLLAAGLALRRTKRLTKVLETYPWRAYPCAYPRRSLESPKSIEIRFTHAYMPVLRITWYSGNLARKRNPSPQTIWFAGDPRYGGVVSPVGGHFPVRVVPEASAQAVSGGGTEEADVLAERAGLVTGGRMHTT